MVYFGIEKDIFWYNIYDNEIEGAILVQQLWQCDVVCRMGRFYKGVELAKVWSVTSD